MAVTIQIFIFFLGLVIVNSHHLHLNQPHQHLRHHNNLPKYFDNLFHPGVFGGFFGSFGNGGSQQDGGYIDIDGIMGRDQNYAPSGGNNIAYNSDQRNFNVGQPNQPYMPDVNIDIAVPNNFARDNHGSIHHQNKFPVNNGNIAIHVDEKHNRPQLQPLPGNTDINQKLNVDTRLNTAVADNVISASIPENRLEVNIKDSTVPKVPGFLDDDIKNGIKMIDPQLKPYTNVNAGLEYDIGTQKLNSQNQDSSTGLEGTVPGLNDDDNKKGIKLIDLQLKTYTNGKAGLEHDIGTQKLNSQNQDSSAGHEGTILGLNDDDIQNGISMIDLQLKPYTNGEVGLEHDIGTQKLNSQNQDSSIGHEGIVLGLNDDIKNGIKMIDPQLKSYTNGEAGLQLDIGTQKLNSQNQDSTTVYEGTVSGLNDDDNKNGIKLIDLQLKTYTNGEAGLENDIGTQKLNSQNQDSSIGHEGIVLGLNDDIKNGIKMIDPQLKSYTNGEAGLQLDIGTQKLNSQNQDSTTVYEGTVSGLNDDDNKNGIKLIDLQLKTYTNGGAGLQHDIGTQKLNSQNQDSSTGLEGTVPGLNDDDIKNGISMIDLQLKSYANGEAGLEHDIGTQKLNLQNQDSSTGHEGTVPALNDDDIKSGIKMIDLQLKSYTNGEARLEHDIGTQKLNLQNHDSSTGHEGTVLVLNDDDIKSGIKMIDPQLKSYTNGEAGLEYDIGTQKLNSQNQDSSTGHDGTVLGLNDDNIKNGIKMINPQLKSYTNGEAGLEHDIGIQKLNSQNQDSSTGYEGTVPGLNDDDIKNGIKMIDPQLKPYTNSEAGLEHDIEIQKLNSQNKDSSTGHEGTIPGLNDSDIKNGIKMIDPQLKYNVNEVHKTKIPDTNIEKDSIKINLSGSSENINSLNVNKISELIGNEVNINRPIEETKVSFNGDKSQYPKNVDSTDNVKVVPGFEDDNIKTATLMIDPEHNNIDVELSKHSDAVVFPDELDKSKKQNINNTDVKQNLPNRFSTGEISQEHPSGASTNVISTSAPLISNNPTQWTPNNNIQMAPLPNNQGTQNQYTNQPRNDLFVQNPIQQVPINSENTCHYVNVIKNPNGEYTVVNLPHNNVQMFPAPNNQDTQNHIYQPSSVTFAPNSYQQVPLNNDNGSPYVNVVKNANGDYIIVNVPNNNNVQMVSTSNNEGIHNQQTNQPSSGVYGQNPSPQVPNGSDGDGSPYVTTLCVNVAKNPNGDYILVNFSNDKYGQDNYRPGNVNSDVNNPYQYVSNAGVNNPSQSYVSDSSAVNNPGQIYVLVNGNSAANSPDQTLRFNDGANPGFNNAGQIHASENLGMNHPGQIYVPVNSGANPSQTYVTNNVPSGGQMINGVYYNVVNLSNGQTVLVPVNNNYNNGQNQWNTQPINGQMYVPVTYNNGQGYQGNNPSGNVLTVGYPGNVGTVGPTNNVPLLISYKDMEGDHEGAEKGANFA